VRKGSLVRKKRILVLDDEPHVQRLLVQGLEASGCEVQPVSHVPDALRLLRGDAVLVDLPVILLAQRSPL
jgi:CheY-like chemotaxis protein